MSSTRITSLLWQTHKNNMKIYEFFFGWMRYKYLYNILDNKRPFKFKRHYNHSLKNKHYNFKANIEEIGSCFRPLLWMTMARA